MIEESNEGVAPTPRPPLPFLAFFRPTLAQMFNISGTGHSSCRRDYIRVRQSITQSYALINCRGSYTSVTLPSYTKDCIRSKIVECRQHTKRVIGPEVSKTTNLQTGDMHSLSLGQERSQRLQVDGTGTQQSTALERCFGIPSDKQTPTENSEDKHDVHGGREVRNRGCSIPGFIASAAADITRKRGEEKQQ